MRAHRRGSSPLSGGHISACPLRHVYVHVPFCARRCVYCDFSIAVRRDVPVDDYVSAIARELEIRFAGEEHWAVSTLYLGGGTPSRLGADGVSRLLDALAKRIEVEPGGEVTLEANPDDVSVEAARAWRDAGINRLSIGAQSFDDRVLAWMHRTHDAAQIGRAVDAARSAGIEDLSIDLIFSLPENVQRSWSTDLDRALAVEPTHVSLYGLTIEPHTPLGRWKERGELDASPDEQYEAEFLGGARGARGRGVRSLRGVELRATGAPCTPQFGVLDAGSVRRLGAVVAWLRRRRAAVERSGVRGVAAADR